MMRAVVLVVVLLSFVAAVACAQERAVSAACVPYIGSPATGGKCDHVISSSANVFIQYPDTYASLDASAGKQTVLMGAFFPPECRNPFLGLACMGSFLNCQFTDEFPNFNVYPPCRSVCEAVVLGCTSFFASQGMQGSLPDCDLIVNSTGQPLPAFPPDGTQCVALKPNLFVPYGEVDCPHPLRYNYDDESTFAESGYNGAQMCVMPCPSPMWSDSEWTAGVTLTLVVNGTSGLLSLFIAVSMCMMPGKRRFPGSLFIYIASCLAALSFIVTFFPIISGGVTRMACTHGSPPVEVSFGNAGDHDGAGVPCILQGIGILYFALAAGLWWLALCWSVFDMVYLRRSVHVIRKWHIPYHFLAWGFPLCAVVTGLGGTAYGAVSGIPWCFLRDSEWWSWGLFYIPVAVMLFLGTVAMTFSVYRFIRVRFRFLGRSGESVEQVVRLLLLLLVYWMVLLYPWGFRIYSRVIQDDLAAAFEQQILCSASTGTECELPTRLNIGSWYLVQIAFGAGGYAMFICCCSSEVIRLWWTFNKLLYTRPLRDALEEIKHMIVGGETGWETRPTESAKDGKSTGSGSGSIPSEVPHGVSNVPEDEDDQL